MIVPKSDLPDSGQTNPSAPANGVNVALAGPATVGATLRQTGGSYYASGRYGSEDHVPTPAVPSRPASMMAA